MLGMLAGHVGDVETMLMMLTVKCVHFLRKCCKTQHVASQDGKQTLFPNLKKEEKQTRHLPFSLFFRRGSLPRVFKFLVPALVASPCFLPLVLCSLLPHFLSLVLARNYSPFLNSLLAQEPLSG